MTKSDVIKEFTKIKGVGKAKAETLYSKGYDSLEKLKSAKIEDLKKIDGITDSIIKNIKDFSKVEVKEKPAKTKTTEKKTEEKKEKPKTEEKVTKTKEEKASEEKKEDEKTEEKYVPKIKPKLSKELKHSLKVRREIKDRTPEFLREEWFRYKKIPLNWRRPDGITSKMRRHFKYRPQVVRVGFRGPKDARGLHSSGFQEIIIYNVNELEKINPEKQAARIGSSVGTKKRMVIEKKAEELKIRLLNI